MKKRSLPNIWPEVIVAFLVFILVWGAVKHSSIPAFAASALFGSTPIPTATPTAPTGTTYLKIPVEEIAQLDDFSNATLSTGAVLAKMITVGKETETAVNGSSTVHYNSEPFCVSLEAFLDKDNLRLNNYDEKKAKYALIGLKLEDLARYGEAIPDKVQIYLVPDPTCGNDSN